MNTEHRADHIMLTAGAEDEVVVVPSNGLVPDRLVTPTDLSPAAVSAITQTVNRLIADTFALYVKTKNFHWHLASRHFRDFHLLFDEQADQLIDSIDLLAERVRRIGGTTLRSVGHIRQLQSISDNNEAYVPLQQMLLQLGVDNQHMAQAQRAAMELADRMHDHATSNLLQALLDETEKRIWFLHASLSNMD